MCLALVFANSSLASQGEIKDERFALSVLLPEGFSATKTNSGRYSYTISVKEVTDTANAYIEAAWAEEAKSDRKVGSLEGWARDYQMESFWKAYSKTPITFGETVEAEEVVGHLKLKAIYHEVSTNGHRRSVVFLYGSTKVAGKEVFYYIRVSNKDWYNKLYRSKLFESLIAGIKLGSLAQ